MPALRLLLCLLLVAASSLLPACKAWWQSRTPTPHTAISYSRSSGSFIAYGAGSERTAPPAVTHGDSAFMNAQSRPVVIPQIEARLIRPAGVTLDFETGDLRGWRATGTAFNFQPTFGDNPAARKREPANHQGNYWIGTYEQYQGPNRGRPGMVQGDGPQGTLISAPLTIQGGTLSFLVGGGSAFETRVELRLLDQIEGSIPVLRASGANSETMHRVTWDVSRWAGRQVEIAIVDAASGGWGHINADDFQLQVASPPVPQPVPSVQQPLPGAAPAPRPMPRPTPQPSPSPAPQPTPEFVIVPDLGGQHVDRARALLGRSRLVLGRVTTRDVQQPDSTVLEQSPPPGTRVPFDTAVHVTVARRVLVRVPNLVGQSEATARDLLRRAGLRPGVISEQPSNEPARTVLAQTVPAGTLVDPETSIGFTVAIERIAYVPNLIGGSITAAGRRLLDAELTLGRTERIESQEPEGTVVAQSIGPGRPVRVGTPVGITIAVPIMVEVPDIIGRELQIARDRVESVRLRLGNLTPRESGDQRPGTVLAQSPRPGERVAIGTVVSAAVARRPTVVVPNLIGRDESEARALLMRERLREGRIDERESGEQPRTVVAQGVPAGTRVEVATPIDFTVATRAMVPVPALIGQPNALARRRLADARLTVGPMERIQSRQPQGTVVEQTIAPDRRVPVGTAVGITIAVPLMVEVPDLVGRTEAEAARLLAGKELTVGAVRHEESSAPSGTVLTQSPGPRTSVAVGTQVAFMVAAIETVPVPAVVGMTIDDARQALGRGRLAVGTVGLQETRDRSGVVLVQSRTPGTAAAVGTVIDVIVTTPDMVSVPNVVGLTNADAIAAITDAGLPVGTVGRRLSMRPGGTVLAQNQPANTAVVFTTPIALQVAQPRIFWLLPAGLLLAVGLLTLARRIPNLRRTKPPEAAPTEPLLHVEPRIGHGVQQVTTAARPLISLEVRLKPVVDPGEQDVHPGRGVVSRERRQHD